jgi:hypothetical protein
VDSIINTHIDYSRGLLFGLLANCIFSAELEEICPLSELRISLSIEEKHSYVMGLSDEKVQSMLMKHEQCYEKRLLEIN